MAALLKKRALAEYSQTVQGESREPACKLRLVGRLAPGGSIGVYVGLLDKCKSSNEALQILIRMSDSLRFQEDDMASVVKKLCEHFHQESEAAVRTKMLALLGSISQERGAEPQSIMDDIVQLLKKEESHKVIAQGMSSLLRIGKLLSGNTAVHQKLVTVAKQVCTDACIACPSEIKVHKYLTDTSHVVKCRCLELLGDLLPVAGASVSDLAATQVTLHLVGDYGHCDEPRVRAAAFKAMVTLHERGLKLDAVIYSEVCAALRDDYEIVRQEALKLVWVLGQTYPDNIVVLPDSKQELRLVDDAFGKICNAMNDLSMDVRALAAEKLGTVTAVSPKFLHQTLDKKLMSNMRKKRSAHELSWQNMTSGEWSSGKKWADDNPREMIDADSVDLMSSGSCGAFVQGLEDEYLEVRSATVEAVCKLSLDNPQFAVMALDFLVDMFNDEIEDVRLMAIDSLTKISRHIELREDQLETILGALKDFSVMVREGLHRMLAASCLGSKDCLQMCVDALVDNLKKYPMDRVSTWQCLQKLGQSHAEMTLYLVPQLLNIHPFFDTPEPDVENPAYVSILVLVFNAAEKCPTMIQLFEQHTHKHYSYLRDTMPHLVPHLKVPGSSTPTELRPQQMNTAQFLDGILARIEGAPNEHVRRELMESSRRDLARLALIDSTIPGALRFSALHLDSQLLMADLLANRLWSHPSALAMQQGSVVRGSITKLLTQCLKLQYLFVGLNAEDLASVKQLKLKALALQLVYIVRGSNSSALALCDHFLKQVDDTHSYLNENGLRPEPLTAALLRELGQREEAKPGPVVQSLLPLLLASTLSPPPRANTAIRSSSAGINEPTGNVDTPLKFTAGLVVGVACDVELRHVGDAGMLRMRACYPDQQSQLSVIRTRDLHPCPDDPSRVRLLSTLLLSHQQVWTEACTVDVSLVMDVSGAERGLTRTLGRRSREDPWLLELCDPVKVCLSPKHIKRGI
ncbi:integrator complex subunit 4 isoform X2 [Bacillus rossius redtenbacheri]|uniref:integrator complex subunit 4 isoform X2 n=1 Tax=Bacillus rossius redtenbacheri TaxID=93214 RepID=UPI002FDD8B64